MSSQSDDFAKMIQLLEEILLELRHNRPVQPTPYYPVQPMVGCSVCGNLQYSCNRIDCPSRITYVPRPITTSTTSTMETCRCGGHGSCQCGVAE